MTGVWLLVPDLLWQLQRITGQTGMENVIAQLRPYH